MIRVFIAFILLGGLVDTLTATTDAPDCSKPLPPGGTYQVQCTTAAHVAGTSNPAEVDGGWVYRVDAGYYDFATSNDLVVPTGRALLLSMGNDENGVCVLGQAETTTCYVASRASTAGKWGGPRFAAVSATESDAGAPVVLASYVGEGALVTGSGVATLSVPIPDGGISDVLVLATSNQTGSPIAGWTTINSAALPGVFWKRTTAAAEGNVTVETVTDTGDPDYINLTAAARVYRFANIYDGGSPVDAYTAVTHGASSTTKAATDVTTTATSDALLHVYLRIDENRYIASISGTPTAAVDGGNSAQGSVLMGYSLDTGASGAKSSTITLNSAVSGGDSFLISLKKAQ